MPGPKLLAIGALLAALEDLRRTLLKLSLPKSSSIEALSETFLGELRKILQFDIGSIYLASKRGTLDQIRIAIGGLSPELRPVSYRDARKTLDTLLNQDKEPLSGPDAGTLAALHREYKDLIGRDFTVERAAVGGSRARFLEWLSLRAATI